MQTTPNDNEFIPFINDETLRISFSDSEGDHSTEYSKYFTDEFNAITQEETSSITTTAPSAIDHPLASKETGNETDHEIDNIDEAVTDEDVTDEGFIEETVVISETEISHALNKKLFASAKRTLAAQAFDYDKFKTSIETLLGEQPDTLIQQLCLSLQNSTPVGSDNHQALYEPPSESPKTPGTEHLFFF